MARVRIFGGDTSDIGKTYLDSRFRALQLQQEASVAAMRSRSDADRVALEREQMVANLMDRQAQREQAAQEHATDLAMRQQEGETSRDFQERMAQLADERTAAREQGREERAAEREGNVWTRDVTQREKEQQRAWGRQDALNKEQQAWDMTKIAADHGIEIPEGTPSQDVPNVIGAGVKALKDEDKKRALWQTLAQAGHVAEGMPEEWRAAAESVRAQKDEDELRKTNWELAQRGEKPIGYVESADALTREGMVPGSQNAPRMEALAGLAESVRRKEFAKADAEARAAAEKAAIREKKVFSDITKKWEGTGETVLDPAIFERVYGERRKAFDPNWKPAPTGPAVETPKPDLIEAVTGVSAERRAEIPRNVQEYEDALNAVVAAKAEARFPRVGKYLMPGAKIGRPIGHFLAADVGWLPSLWGGRTLNERLYGSEFARQGAEARAALEKLYGPERAALLEADWLKEKAGMQPPIDAATAAQRAALLATLGTQQ